MLFMIVCAIKAHMSLSKLLTCPVAPLPSPKNNLKGERLGREDKEEGTGEQENKNVIAYPALLS